MDDLGKFKNQIIKYGMIAAVLIELGSFFFIGVSFKFFGGLLFGTVTSIVNFNLMVYTGKKVSTEERRAPAVFGYFIRMPIYGIVFFLCIRTALSCGAGCACGFITTQLGIFYLYGIRSRFPGARKNPLNDSDEPRTWRSPDEWDDDDDWGVSADQQKSAEEKEPPDRIDK